MTCNICGQATVVGHSGVFTFLPCQCPVDKEEEEKRVHLIRKKIDEGMAKLASKCNNSTIQ